MSDTTFVDGTTVIIDDWLNDINDFFYTTFGGTAGGGITAATGRTSLSAAKSGANSDITSLTGLTTPLSVAQGGTAATTAGGALTALGVSAFAQTVLDDTTAALARATLAAIGNIASVQVLTTPGAGTYTPTSGSNRALVICQGAGGGGGGSSATNTWVGGGGAAGGFCVKLITSGLTTSTINIGAEGTAGTSTGAGGTGGNTTWNDGTVVLAANGGVGGAVGGAAAAAATGGTATGGDINIKGNSAPHGVITTSVGYLRGGGAASRLGAGGVPVNNDTAGAQGTGYGVGGSGGNRQATTSRAGGAGTQGIIIVFEFV